MSRRAIFLSILIVLSCGVSYIAMWMWIGYRFSDPTERRPLPNVAAWPEPIRDIESELKRAGIDTNRVEVYLLSGTPDSLLSTVICRMPDDPDSWQVVSNHLNLVDVTNAPSFHFPTEGTNHAPPDWWPESTEAVSWYASQRLLDGEEGTLYVVARDTEAGRVFIHYHFNF